MLWFLTTLTTLLEANFFETTTAVNPACECIFFDGFGLQSNGTFMSPNYPVPYDTDILCLLYTFVGSEGELVELTFDHFELQPRETNGKCLDFVRVFQDLEEPAVNEVTEYQAELCGAEVEPGQKFYSRGRALIFEFHSDTYPGEQRNQYRGFIGEFQFLDKRLFQTDGNKIAEADCYYDIPSRQERLTGKVFSPNYPYHYPPNIDCYYYFQARPGQRVRITIKELYLPPVDGSCINAADQVLVYQNAAGDRYRSTSAQQQTMIGRFCGRSFVAETVISSGPRASMHFKAGPNTDRIGRGFYAEYEFTSELPPKLPHQPTQLPPIINPSSGHDCNFDISSAESTQGGVIVSPLWPQSYPSDTKCTYTFTSKGAERVQIIFQEFNLFLPDADRQHMFSNGSYRCKGENDHLSAYVMLDSRMSEIDTFCGSETPPQLMSSKNYLSMEFIAKSDERHRSNNGKYRFKFMYRFVDDFGIKTGRRARNHVCGFIFNSTEANNGTIYSPNYPGYYPRKTDCHYEFRGLKNERIRIYFTYFDVEGFKQCHNDTQSDYVKFSNYQTEDRTNQRFCGTETPMKYQPIESESNYFRMVFHSNAIFDATGFYAAYQFNKPPKAAIRSVKSGAGSNCEHLTVVTLIVPISLTLSSILLFIATQK